VALQPDFEPPSFDTSSTTELGQDNTSSTARRWKKRRRKERSDPSFRHKQKRHMEKHIRQSYNFILRILDTWLKFPSSEIVSFLTHGLAMHGLLSLILSRLEPMILVDAIIIINGLIFVLWIVSRKLSSLLQTFLETYFVLDYNLQKQRTSMWSIIGHGFSHMDYKHLTANMAALNIFSDYAISTLGSLGFIQLFSGGLIVSAWTSCLWPTPVAKGFDGKESKMSTVVGASGPISAIITFVCLTYREYVIPIETPIWLKMFLPNDEIEVSFALAGLLWFVNDIFGSFYRNRYFNDDESNMEKEKYIAYSSHVGGPLFFRCAARFP